MGALRLFLYSSLLLFGCLKQILFQPVLMRYVHFLTIDSWMGPGDLGNC